MKRTISQGNDSNQEISQLCYDMDIMELRSQTSVGREDCLNRMKEMDKNINEALETQVDNDDNSFTDDIGNLAFSSTIQPKITKEQMMPPAFAESVTINEIYQNKKAEAKPLDPVSANQKQEKQGKFNQFDDIESVSSSIMRLPKNENKIRITAIQFKTYDQIDNSLDLQSNYFRRVNHNEDMIRTNMKFTKMNGVDIVRERSKCKNPRPSSGTNKSKQDKLD